MGPQVRGSEQEAKTPVHSQRTRNQPEPVVKDCKIRDVEIKTIGDQGDGISKVERDYVVIGPDAEPGDEPTIEVKEV